MGPNKFMGSGGGGAEGGSEYFVQGMHFSQSKNALLLNFYKKTV